MARDEEDVYVRRRHALLANILRKKSRAPATILDFGCGIGLGTNSLLQIFNPKLLVGVDLSAQSVAAANARFGSDKVHFYEARKFVPGASFDLVVSCNIFRSILPAQRHEATSYIYESLRPGGVFALWENNPWNPATCYVMANCKYDESAASLSPHAAKKIIKTSRLEIIQTNYLFLLPQKMKGFQWIEGLISSWQLGWQYQLLSRKPHQSRIHN